MELSRPNKVPPSIAPLSPRRSSSVALANVVAPASPSKAAAQRQASSLARQTEQGVQELERKRQELIALAQSRARNIQSSNQSNDSSQSVNKAQTERSAFLSKAHSIQQTLLEKQQREHQAQFRRKEAAQRDTQRSSGLAAAPASLKSKNSQGPFSRNITAAHSDSDHDAQSDTSQDPYSIEADEIQQNQRDDDLALIEHLEPGPKRIPAPKSDDPGWEHFEPYSGHSLRERTLPHGELTEYLRGRYQVSPSLLYSIARPLETSSAYGKPGRDGDYEVPVDGDWIVMATIVQKSETRVTKGFSNDADTSSTTSKIPASASIDVDDPVVFKGANMGADGTLRLDLEPGSHDDTSSSSWRKGRSAADQELEEKREQNRLSQRPRKFIVLQLTDLGVHAAAALGEGSGVVGSNTLSMVVYEADQVDATFVSHKAKVRPEVAAIMAKSSERKYINGSRGAFELLFKQAEGTVIAIMNPKVLKPYGNSKILKLSPRSGEDCMVIGQCSDYQRCSATKASGERCGNFVDVRARKKTRVQVCDFHLERQMDSMGKSRPEFAVNATSKIGRGGESRSQSSRQREWMEKRDQRAEKDGTAKFFLKRNSNGGAPTDGMENNSGKVYVSSGSTPLRDSDPMSNKYDVSERYGRGVTVKQARLRRQLEEEELKSQIVARFGEPKRAMSAVEVAQQTQRTQAEEPILPVLPNGSAEMINAAYSTLQERKRKASLQSATTLAKRKKYTGVVQPTDGNEADNEPSKLQFMKHSSSSKSCALVNGVPVPNSLSNPSQARGRDRDARSTLVALAASKTRTPQSAPSLKLKKSHRPKLRIPEQDLTTHFVAGERYHIDDFGDDWETDLQPQQTRPPTLFSQLATSKTPAPTDNADDSDGLEFI